jgi:hypothetical protein
VDSSQPERKRLWQAAIKWPLYSLPNSNPADKIIGIMATEYNGHFIAACQSRFLSG